MGIAIRYSRVLKGPKMVWRGWTPGRGHLQKKLSVICFLVIEIYDRGIKQGQKSNPDLVESMMKAPGLVKEELWRISCKMNQFRPEITKIRV